MSSKRLVQLFLLSALIGIGWLPLLNVSQLPASQWLSPKTWQQKTLYSTDRLERVANYLYYKSFNRSRVTNKVVAGRDAFLFLGNAFERVLDKSTGRYMPHPQRLERRADELLALQQWYEQRGVKFAFVVAPNKHTVYRDRLRDAPPPEVRTQTDRLIALCRERNVHVLDLRQRLRAERDKGVLYLKSDTHWNRLGASLAFRETVQYLNDTFGLALQVPPYSLHEVRRPAGDLARFLKIESMLPPDYEREYEYVFEHPLKVCVGDIGRQTMRLKQCRDEPNPPVSLNARPRYVNNPESPNAIRLLFVGDSFATANSQLYNATFAALWKFHFKQLNAYLDAFVRAQRPDVALYQVVERDLLRGELTLPLKPSPVREVDLGRYAALKPLLDVREAFMKSNARFSFENETLTVTHKDPFVQLKPKPLRGETVLLVGSIGSPVKTRFQIYYKERPEERYGQERSFSVALQPGDNRIALALPARLFRHGLRIDPVNKPGRYTISELMVYEPSDFAQR